MFLFSTGCPDAIRSLLSSSPLSIPPSCDRWSCECWGKSNISNASVWYSDINLRKVGHNPTVLSDHTNSVSLSLSLSLGLSVTTDYCIAHQLDPAHQTDLTPGGSGEKPLRELWHQMIPSQSGLSYWIRTRWRMETWRVSPLSLNTPRCLCQNWPGNLFIFPGVTNF